MRTVVSRSVIAAALAVAMLGATSLHAQAAKPPAKPPTAAQTPPAKPPATAAAPAATPVDINTATVDQLKAVKGIGDTYAAKIVAGRPYTNKSQLVSKKVLPQKVYDKVKAHLIAKQ